MILTSCSVHFLIMYEVEMTNNDEIEGFSALLYK